MINKLIVYVEKVQIQLCMRLIFDYDKHVYYW